MAPGYAEAGGLRLDQFFASLCAVDYVIGQAAHKSLDAGSIRFKVSLAGKIGYFGYA